MEGIQPTTEGLAPTEPVLESLAAPTPNYKEVLGIWGIVTALLGTLYLGESAFAFKGSYIETGSGRQFHALFLDDVALSLSLSLVVLSFVIQFLEKIWDKIPTKYQRALFTGTLWQSILLIVYLAFYRFTGLY